MKVQGNLHGYGVVLHEMLQQISFERILKQHCPRAAVAGQEEAEVRYLKHQVEKEGTRNECGGKLSN